MIGSVGIVEIIVGKLGTNFTSHSQTYALPPVVEEIKNWRIA
jgi:hypothetical protein